MTQKSGHESRAIELKLLDVQRRLDAARSELVAAESALEKARRRLSRCETDRSAANDALNAHRVPLHPGGISAGELELYQVQHAGLKAHYERAELTCETAKAEVNRTEKRVNECRLLVRQVEREMKVLERVLSRRAANARVVERRRRDDLTDDA